MKILITGAASGIGRGLACRLARADQHLVLGDCDPEGLNETRRLCENLGATVKTRVLDTRDREDMAAWIHAEGTIRLDMVFACAGITGGLPPANTAIPTVEREDHARLMIETNLLGSLNTLFPAMDVMKKQALDPSGQRGRICVIASVAGFVSYPGTPSYSASKAALDRFTVATAPTLEKSGITLTSVCCGFVDTPMVRRNRFPMPGLVSTDTAVRQILRGTLRGKRRITFPKWLVLGARLTDLLPPRLTELYYCRQPSARPHGMPDY
ncbi:SDR family NAD(P)-dependent oxidoreductase [Gluconobacter sp. NFX36]|uniref:SDR family NAD(P)-dependent oxidoreductase n=1 Tax=Gluconobacter TaxID=441 RepID=UPI003CF523E0